MPFKPNFWSFVCLVGCWLGGLVMLWNRDAEGQGEGADTTFPDNAAVSTQQ